MAPTMTPEKRAALLDLLNGDESLLELLLARIEHTDKAARASGVVYKSAGGYPVAGRNIFESLIAANERRMR